MWGSRIWVHVEGGTKLGGHVAEGCWVGVDDNSPNGCRVYWLGKRSVTVERNIYWDPSSVEPLSREGEEEESNVPNVILTAPTPVPVMTTVSPTPATPILPKVQPPPDEPPVTKQIRKPSQRIADILAGRGQPTVPRGVQLPTKITDSVPLPDLTDPLDVNNIAAAYLMTIVEDSDDVLCAINLAMAMEGATAESEALEQSSLAEARRRPDWLQWEAGIKEELATLQAAGTWELVDIPRGANIVGSKWVFRAKKDAAGHVVRHKAHLVTQGYLQVKGVNYFDTFALVATLASIRTVLTMEARSNLELHQINIKGTYLNGTLTNDEVIYMQQPPGFESTDHPHKVCRLRKTLYSLKQSRRRWYQRLVEILVNELGFTQCSVDQAVYFRWRTPGELIIVVVHVDDCTIAAKSLNEIDEFKRDVRKHVEITDLGELHWLLGIEVTRNRDECTISLCQRPYLKSIVHRFGFDELKPVSNLMELSTKLHSGQSLSTGTEYAAMCHIPYCKAVGSLMYASLATRCYDSIARVIFTDNCFSFTSTLADALCSMDMSCYLDSLTLCPRYPYHVPLARVLVRSCSRLLCFLLLDTCTFMDCRLVPGYLFVPCFSFCVDDSSPYISRLRVSPFVSSTCALTFSRLCLSPFDSSTRLCAYCYCLCFPFVVCRLVSRLVISGL